MVRTAVPEALKPRFGEITERIAAATALCLNEECADVARELASALARKRPSPLLKGRATTWAAGILFTVARVNFLFDPKEQPHCKSSDLAAACGASDSAAAAKARDIERLFDIVPLDPAWTLPSRLADNPLAWLLEIDGLLVDARQLPRVVQEEAVRLGLIPYLP